MRALRLPPDAYAVFGSAPLLAHGLIAEVGDIDILAVGSAWRLAQELASPVRAPGGDRVVRLGTDLELYNGWLGLHLDAIVCRAELMDGLPIAHLDDVAAYKRLLNRPKDVVHLKLLEAYIRR